MHFNKKILAGLLILTSSAVYASSNWTTSQGNAAHTGYVDIKTNPENFHVLWTNKFEIERDKNDTREPHHFTFLQGMIVADDVAYFSHSQDFHEGKGNEDVTMSALTAVDVNTGKTKWQKIVNFHADSISMPTYDKGKVFVVTNGDDGNSLLNAYLPESGKLDFSLPLHNNFEPVKNIEANAGNIYIYGHHILSSINSGTGKYNWSMLNDKSQLPIPMPAVGNRYIIQQTRAGIEVGDPATGKWSFEIEASDAYPNAGITTLPVLDEERNVSYQQFYDFQADDYFSLYAFDLEKRSVKWSIASQFGQPVVAGNDIYIIGYDEKQNAELHAIDAETGKINWTWQQLPSGNYMPELIIATKDLVFVQKSDRTIAISRKTHKKVWEIAKEGELVIASNKLFIIRYVDEYKLEVTAVQLS